MKVYYDNTLLKEVDTLEDAEQVILDALRTVTYYYLRCWKPNENTVIYDYGSHTKFYKVVM